MTLREIGESFTSLGESLEGWWSRSAVIIDGNTNFLDAPILDLVGALVQLAIYFLPVLLLLVGIFVILAEVKKAAYRLKSANWREFLATLSTRDGRALIIKKAINSFVVVLIAVLSFLSRGTAVVGLLMLAVGFVENEPVDFMIKIAGIFLVSLCFLLWIWRFKGVGLLNKGWLKDIFDDR